MADDGIKTNGEEIFPVVIADCEIHWGDPIAVIDDMPYDKANDFLNAFNNGIASWDGRVW